MDVDRFQFLASLGVTLSRADSGGVVIEGQTGGSIPDSDCSNLFSSFIEVSLML